MPLTFILIPSKGARSPLPKPRATWLAAAPGRPIDPTPTVAMVGLIEKAEHITTQWFKDEGDAILLLGGLVDTSDPWLGLGGSAYLQVAHGLKAGAPPRCQLETERELHLVLR